MGKPFIVDGDTTTKRGRVIASATTTTTHGKPIARVGDKVTCHRDCRITSGDTTMIIDGQAAAREGDSVSCGAKLISTQQVSTD